MNLGIKKMALGGVAALAIAGGALSLTNCNKADKGENVNSTAITQEDVDNYHKALSNANKAYLEARQAEITDSLNYSKNPTTENYYKYLSSHSNTNLNKNIMELTKKYDTPEARAKDRQLKESLLNILESLNTDSATD